jgi:hypothetical protein
MGARVMSETRCERCWRPATLVCITAATKMFVCDEHRSYYAPFSPAKVGIEDYWRDPGIEQRIRFGGAR